MLLCRLCVVWVCCRSIEALHVESEFQEQDYKCAEQLEVVPVPAGGAFLPTMLEAAVSQLIV